MRKLLLFTLTLLLFHNSFATHLIGGSMGYSYVGKFGNNYRYKIILTTYTNCGPGSNIPTPEGPDLTVGIYQHNTQNDPLAPGNKTHQQNVTVTLVSSNQIQPGLPPGCSVGASTCIYKGVYEGTVDLPLNFNGYHIYYERCCRNGSIVNLIPSESMAFHAFIPPPLIENSTPEFTDDPVPFVCAGDTTSLLNSAYDPDGDLLVFSFVTPYNGFANAGNPAPAPPQPSLGWTIPNVSYAAGFSMAQPFGTGGYSHINASTGLTTYYAPSTGDYVVAIEIKEYRNGNLIGITRRDLQILVLNCPVNPPPNIDPALGTTSTSFSIEEGETLCFDIGFNDPNGDSIILTSNGQIFDASIINPAATISTPAADLDTVSAQFCWTTDCGQAQALPYQFQVSAQDRGCPPKTTNLVYQITVNPVAPPDTIMGPEMVCQNSTETYTTNAAANSTFEWSVTGGTITTGNTGTSVDIQWGNPGTGIITLKKLNQYGCESEAITREITILTTPQVDVGNDTSICIGDSIVINGSTTASSGYTLSWSPTDSIINETTLTPTVFPSDTTAYILSIDLGSICVGKDTINVMVNIPTVDAGVDTAICAGDSVQLNGSSSPGTILWSPAADLDDASSYTPWASPTTTTDYIITLTDGIGCAITDTMTLTVDVGFTLTTTPDTSICANDCFNLMASGATDYAWEPAASLNDSTLPNPLACPTANTTYTVYAQTGACLDTGYVDVTINNLPTVDAGTDVTICFGDTIQLTATGATGYTWTPADSISNTGIANPMVWPSDTTMYYVTGTDGNGCSAIDSVQVNVNPLPTVSAGNDVSYCIGDSTQLNATGADTYVWTPTTDLSDPNIANPYATGTGNMTYIVEGTDANGCVNTDTIDITVNALPVITLSNDTTICENDTITLVAGGGDTYNWNPTTNLGTPTQATTTAFPTTTTTYEVIVTDGNGCIDSAEVVVTVNPAPAVDAGADVTICFGDTIQLTATGATGYTWTPADSISNTGIANPMVWPSDTTIYYVTGSDANSCSLMDSVQVNVNPLPNVMTGNDTSYCIGDSVQLNATGADTYVWTPTTDLSDPNIANPYATGTGNMTYIVEGTDANGCVNTDTIDVTVNALPVITISNDTTICINDTISLTAGGGDTYSWNPTATLGTPTQATTTAFPVTTTTYEAIVTDLNGCVDSAEVDVTVQTLPAVDAGLDVDICFGDTIQLTATGATGYTWAPADSISNINIADPLVWPSDTTEYIVTGNDALGCINTDTLMVNVNPLPNVMAGNDTSYCIGDSVQLNATGADTYVWTPTTDLSDPNIANPYATGTGNMTYIVEGTDANGCVNTDTIDVTVNALPVITISNDTTICINDTISLTAGGGDTYSWNPTATLGTPSQATTTAFPVTTTTYEAIVTDLNGCVDSAEVDVTVQTLPAVDAGLDVDICFGDTIQLTATGATGYTWAPADSISNINIADPLVWPSDTTEYIVTGADGLNCINTDTVVVNVNPLPTPDAGPDLWVCPGDQVQINATGGGTYSWSPATGLSDPNIDNPMAGPADTTTYILSVTDGNGCIDTDTMTVFVNATVPTDAGTDTTICEGDTIQIGGAPTSVNGTTFFWTPAGLVDDPNVANPMAFPTVDTWFYVATTNDTCSGLDSVLVTVNPYPLANAGADIQICIGDTAQLGATGGVSYVWTPDLDLSDDSIAGPQAWPMDTTAYVVAVTDANGCTQTDTMEVIVNPLPTVSAGADDAICLGDTAQLSASGGDLYTWTPADSLSDANIFDPMAWPTATTDYMVTVTDSNGCINSDTMTLTVNSLPVVDAGTDVNICIGDSTQLGASGADTYVWTPGTDLSDPNIADPWATSIFTQNYVVEGTDGNGCQNTDTVLVVVNNLPM